MSRTIIPFSTQARSRALRVLSRRRAPFQLTIDASAWTAGIGFAAWARFDFEWHLVDPFGLALVAAMAVVAQVVAGVANGLYIGRWRFGSFDEVAALARTVAIATLLVFLVARALDPRPVPQSAVLVGGLAALVGMSGTRYMWRLAVERLRRPNSDPGTTRLLVFGAGEGGAQVITSMLRDPESPYIPVALVDDDRAKRKLRIMGVPVVGPRERLAEAARRHRADTVLIAIPSAGHDLIGELTDIASAAGLKVKVLPATRELFGANVDVRHIRSLTEADLLGRHEIRTDLESIAGYLEGKRVLVTGAGGSIGSELCRQIHKFAPAALIMTDRDESGLHGVQLSIEGRALLDSPDLVVLDIRDRPGIERLFADRRPEVVFHAAALKHLPLLERHPGEAVQTNVWGTLNLLEVAASTGVDTFVNISTDKAADPCSVLGYSKRIGERMTAHFGVHAAGRFLSVRFGNVLGSRGSMLTTFKSQIQAGGPVTVTHPDATRYFMTVEEAVELVIQAGAIGGNGESLVLDMGQAVRIAEVAERLASQADDPVEIVYTGLRPGEKLHEALFGRGERDERRSHQLISHVSVPPLDPGATRDLDPSRPAKPLVTSLGTLAQELDGSCRPLGSPPHASLSASHQLNPE